ncbi:LPXTG cell wall anchor domain-containing protein [Lactobacillus mulieris]|uniref:MucBP domain-containing protein n=1 Tax=Lactobacillus TaxID=1578 RepID=UPI001179DEB0|nr:MULTISPECIES: MucBP domain-containing protein [Lactobacillus]MCW8124937.1 MucBP domain-containing protein [Lactobacillus mulieris]MCZ3728140.1 MucBP domain-containing protein [Lactobacillus jensenii]MCZ3737276.1 MucBP domain-containing protein [Lactobacillus jensenii]MDK6783031.1 MucBP domain-containing protein [Lactobacillus jensenii]MDK7328102.1 MucBP domain-containing protein [Lactobacillus mulieris]
MDKLHKQQVAKRQRFAIKKLTVRTASVLVGLLGLPLIISGNAKADNTTVAAQNTSTTQVTDPQVSAHSSNIRISDESNTVGHQTSSTLVPNKTTTPAQQMPIIHKTTAKQPLPSKYNITMNFRDVTIHKPIQVISNGHYVFKQPFKQTTIRPGDSVDQEFTVAGYKLMNSEVLNKYFYFDKQGNACLKKGITTQDININLDYASLSPIKIEYVDVDNGHILASIVLDSFWMTPESLQHRAGDKKAPDASRYEAAAINIPGYKLVSEPVLKGKITGQTRNSLADPNYVYLTFKYKKVVKNNSDSNRTEFLLVPEEANLPDKLFTIAGSYGERIDLNNGNYEKKMSEEISHYEKQGYSYIGSTGTYLNSDYFNFYAQGIHVYLLPNKPVTVRYIDEQGNMLRNNDTLAFNLDNPNQKNNGVNPQKGWYANGSWQVQPKKIKGYRLVRTLGVTSGQYTVYQYTTTFVYTKDTDPTDPKTPETTTTDPKTPSDKLPDNPGKNYPKGVNTTDLNKTITRKITVIKPDGTKEAHDQTVKYKVVDPQGKVVGVQTVPGKTGQTVPVNIHIPDGYQLVPGESVPTSYTFKDGNPDQIIKVALIPTNDHQGQGTPATNTPTNTTPNGNDVTGKLEGNVPNMQTWKTITSQPTTAKDNQLPQTGNDNSLTLMGLGASTLLGMFGLAAVNKKRK